MTIGLLELASAFHLACALVAKCDCFVSVDDRVLKYPTDVISLCNPVDFLKVWEGLKYDEQHGSSQ